MLKIIFAKPSWGCIIVVKFLVLGFLKLLPGLLRTIPWRAVDAFQTRGTGTALERRKLMKVQALL